ncbi:MAG: alcohol dehydrogenase catalytic domain-containing protein [Acidobacteriota bacterium]
MKGIAVTPRVPNTARIVDVPEPKPKPGELLIQIREVGYCGTDVEINAGLYGAAPDGSDFLILGHESFGRVADAGKRVKGFKKGDLVVATVRRPCAEKCASCRNGESDMCTTGHFKERGIGGLHGYMQELVTEVPDFVVKVPKAIESVAVLLEPMSVPEGDPAVGGDPAAAALEAAQGAHRRGGPDRHAGSLSRTRSAGWKTPGSWEGKSRRRTQGALAAEGRRGVRLDPGDALAELARARVRSTSSSRQRDRRRWRSSAWG